MHKFYFYLLTLLITSFSLAQNLSNVIVSSRLQDAIENANSEDFIAVTVFLSDQVNITALDDQLYNEYADAQKRAKDVITALKLKAVQTQIDLTNYFSSEQNFGNVFRFKSLWIVNMFIIEANPSVLNELMMRNDISEMDLVIPPQLDQPTNEYPAELEVASMEPGLGIIHADQLWALGITGLGRLVMGIDTGVDGNHPALDFKWRGTHVPWQQAWFDPNGSNFPSDCDSHGSHTMGTMVGRSQSTSDTVGVAPDAEWIASRTLCSGGGTTFEAFQWALDPDGDSTTVDDMPDVINNSWHDPGTVNECNGAYFQLFNTLEAAGIAVVFSAGNAGPGASTITKPKNINNDTVSVFCVGNIDGALYLAGSNDPIRNSSSRGPSQCGGQGTLLIKPEVCAPGTNVRSSIPGGGYGFKTGTSMAAPHSAGAIVLLKQAFPNLTGRQIKMALILNTEDLGISGEDNTYGTGLIDVFAAYQYLLSIIPVEFTSFTANIISGVVKLNWSTATETNNYGFIIERRTELEQNWNELGFISGSGNSTEHRSYFFVDEQRTAGKVFYRLKQVDFDGSFKYSNTIELVNDTPIEFSLMQNYPNPFNPSTVIEFSIAEISFVTLEVYSAIGEKVKTILSENLQAGIHQKTFDASALPSGLYIYSIKSVNSTNVLIESKKMLLIK